MNRHRHLLGKNLDVFPQNSTFSIQLVMIILKIDVILGQAVFLLLLESAFSLKLSLLLKSSVIRWQWLLFYLIEIRGKYKQVIKFRYYFINQQVQNDVSVDSIWSCSTEGNFIAFLCYDYKTLLQFFAHVSTTKSAGMVLEVLTHFYK